MEVTDMLLPTLPLAELVIRGSVTFLVLYTLIRVVGRRESGGLGLTDVLVIVLAADAASTGMNGDSKSIGDGFVLVCVILGWSMVIDALSYRFPRFASIAKAGPKPLIENGELVRRTLRREFMTEQEVMTQLRMHEIDDVSLVEHAYLEPNGSVSIVRRVRADEDAG